MLDYVKKLILNDSLLLGDDQSPKDSYSYLFDNRNLFLSSKADVLSFIANSLWQKIKHLKPEVLFTKGVAGYPLLIALKQEASKENINLICLFAREERKKYGLKKIIEGAAPVFVNDKKAVFVDDLFNKGKTFEETKKILAQEEYNLNIVGCCVVIDFWHINGSRQYSLNNFPIFSFLKRHDLNLTRQDHNLKRIVEKINWRSNKFHDGKDILQWKSAPTLYNDLLFVGNDDGHHYCFKKNNGDLKWINKSKNPQPKGDVSVTQFYENKAYWSSYDGTVKCCDVETGKNIWTTKIDLNLHSSPTLDSEKNRLFIGTEWNKYSMRQGGYGEGDVVCLRMSDGFEIWRFKTNGMIPCCVAHSKLNNTVISGSNDFHVYILHADTGQLIKKIPTRGEVKGKISLSKEGDKAIGVSIQGHAYCFCTKTGDIFWSKRIGFNALHSYPTVFDNFVAITNNKGVISCIDIDTGEIVWVNMCRDDLGWGLININEKNLLGITEKGQLHIFNKNDGKKLSNDNLSTIVGEKLTILQPPSYDGENLYVVSNNSGLFSFKINV